MKARGETRWGRHVMPGRRKRMMLRMTVDHRDVVPIRWAHVLAAVGIPLGSFAAAWLAAWALRELHRFFH